MLEPNAENCVKSYLKSMINIISYYILCQMISSSFFGVQNVLCHAALVFPIL
jgi:hypothetical protein